jgi:hypothetical protein
MAGAPLLGVSTFFQDRGSLSCFYIIGLFFYFWFYLIHLLKKMQELQELQQSGLLLQVKPSYT